MTKAKQLPSGNWRVREYSHSEIKRDKNGNAILDSEGNPKVIQRYKSFTASNKRAAEKMAALWKYEREKSQSLPLNITVREAITRYINAKNHTLSPATVREYKRSLNRDLQGLMNLRLDKLTAEKIQQELNLELISHSAKTVRNMYGLLSPSIKMFRPDFSFASISLPFVRLREFSLPSDEDIVELLQYFKETCPDMVIACSLAAFGSFRRSEVCARVSGDVDGNSILVNSAMVQDENKRWVIKITKTEKSQRRVIFPESVIELLKEKDGFLVSLNPNRITRKFSDARKKLGLPYFRFQDLRAYQASILHALNIPDKYIMERGGWKGTQTLNKVYKRSIAKKASETDEIANNYFSNLFSKTLKE